MKKLILLSAVLLFNSAINAQTFKNTGSGLNQVVIDKEDLEDEEEEELSDENVTADSSFLNNLSMDMEEKEISFSTIPKNKTLKVYVTDSRGNERIVHNIDNKKNTVSIQKLKAGIYFATVIDESLEKRKSFVVTID